MTSISLLSKYSSHELLQTSNGLPKSIQLIICEYSEETWAQIMRSNSIFCCFLYYQNQDLADSVQTANISKAIYAIQSGAHLSINSSQFIHLLNQNHQRFINFIFAQMNFYESDFTEVRKSFVHLKGVQFTVGVGLFLRYSKKLCCHEKKYLYDLAKIRFDQIIMDTLHHAPERSICDCDIPVSTNYIPVSDYSHLSYYSFAERKIRI